MSQFASSRCRSAHTFFNVYIQQSFSNQNYYGSVRITTSCLELLQKHIVRNHFFAPRSWASCLTTVISKTCLRTENSKVCGIHIQISGLTHVDSSPKGGHYGQINPMFPIFFNICLFFRKYLILMKFGTVKLCSCDSQLG